MSIRKVVKMTQHNSYLSATKGMSRS